MRLSYLSAVLEDGDMAELRDTLAVIAESRDVDLPPLREMPLSLQEC